MKREEEMKETRAGRNLLHRWKTALQEEIPHESDDSPPSYSLRENKSALPPYSEEKKDTEDRIKEAMRRSEEGGGRDEEERKRWW